MEVRKRTEREISDLTGYSLARIRKLVKLMNRLPSSVIEAVAENGRPKRVTIAVAEKIAVSPERVRNMAIDAILRGERVTDGMLSEWRAEASSNVQLPMDVIIPIPSENVSIFEWVSLLKSLHGEVLEAVSTNVSMSDFPWFQDVLEMIYGD